MPGAEIIALVGLALNIVVALVGLTWGIAKIRDAMRAEIEAHREKFDDEVGELERRIGETFQALRQKIGDVELHGANNYVRRDGYYKVQEQISTEFRSLRDSIDARFVRIEEQISHLRQAAS